jgi:serine/threonine protein kinase
MPGEFDSYHKWLGIPPEEQPPNHYRLLGIRLFESDPDVIDLAADQRMAHLHTFQHGPHSEACHRLLTELSAARICLLNVEKRAAYDQALRKTLSASDAAPTPPPISEVRSSLASKLRLALPPSMRARTERKRGDSETMEYIPGVTLAKPTEDQEFTLKHLGEYRLLEKLGEGGMGSVYKAVHTKLRRTVAVKVLPKGRIEDPRAIARFEREMAAVGAIDHPNVVRAHDAREIEGTRFLVMEYVEGRDLTELIRAGGSMPVADACELARQAALGLQAAHEHELVHRDIKPSNLMLTKTGSVKILDLGLARFEKGDQASKSEATATDQMVGTPDYMAPEQITESQSIDIRTDIYALGCTLYALLAGHPPFRGPNYRTTFEKISAHVKEPVPPITHIRLDVPKPLLAVLDRMLAKEPDERFATPGEVAEAIKPFAAGSNLSALLESAEGESAGAGQEFARAATKDLGGSSGTHPEKVIGGSGSRQKKARMTRLAIILLVSVALTLAIGLMDFGSQKEKSPGSPASSPPATAPATGGEATPASR